MKKKKEKTFLFNYKNVLYIYTLYGVKIDRIYYFRISFFRAVDDIINIIYGKIILCHDITPQ